MYFFKKAKLKKKVVDRYSKLLDIVDFSEDSETFEKFGGVFDDYYRLFELVFENGKHFVFNICSGNHNYYDDCYLTDPNGNEIYCLECTFEIPTKSIVFDYKNDHYRIDITLI